MEVPAVRNAVQAISEALGQIDANIFSTEPANTQLVKNHPAYLLLNGSVNGWTSGAEFREQLTRDALLFGNGVAAITRDAEGVPIELNRLETPRVRFMVHPDTMEPVYFYTPLDGESIEYSFSDVIHLKTSSLNGVTGESPIIQAREAIALAIVLQDHAARLFKNGARPAATLNIPGKLTPEAVTRIKAQVAAGHAGRESGQTFVLEEGAEFKTLSFSSVDSQYAEMRSFAINEIARVFRVSPTLLAELGRATYSNSTEFGRQFICFTLAPWVKRWENEIALKLFDPETKGQFRVELDTDQFDRADLNTRAIAYSSMIAARVMNPNEARALEGLPPYAGGEAFLNPNIQTQETVSV